MDIHPQILTFGGSLIAILAITGFAKLLRLGGKPTLSNEDEARRAATEVVDGYEASEVALDTNGAGALLRDASSQIMVIKPHGNQFAGRILTSQASVLVEDGHTIISTGEARFGCVTLMLARPEPWVDAINRLNGTEDA
ncbi:hypothetical protein [Erythrobacter crassostreae]|uniref:Uncharacterized protein n=1 Tax=Erythrobacter crassostreae TaxID=2828328 RepID=A0A9X1F1Q4_9SPHN|nr:hypothetical protein [Erythrobacter crassostrea]MBV7258411.1 hypothetical protein [Erythrobacter crassostrea]